MMTTPNDARRSDEPAGESYHLRCMNVACSIPRNIQYVVGHKEARHACAEIAAQADAALAERDAEIERLRGAAATAEAIMSRLGGEIEEQRNITDHIRLENNKRAARIAELEAVVGRYEALVAALKVYGEDQWDEADAYDGFGMCLASCGVPVCGAHIVRPGKSQCDCDYKPSPLAKVREAWEALPTESAARDAAEGEGKCKDAT